MNAGQTFLSVGGAFGLAGSSSVTVMVPNVVARALGTNGDPSAASGDV